MYPGGASGKGIADLLHHTLGFDGATIFLLLTWGIGFSLFSSLSWIDTAEKIGGLLETGFRRVLDAWHAYRDRKAGLSATSERDEIVNRERKRMKKDAPVRIEVPKPVIQKSDRADHERQELLFRDIPDGQLPPLRLLDAASAMTTQIDAASLEATSRLIERKLREFGVEVKVLAAYPGPVVTRYEIEPASSGSRAARSRTCRRIWRAPSPW